MSINLKTLNGHSFDAAVLGGKAPEYYLPAVQLLDNPDFSIAQAGYGGYHGSTKYAADRWRAHNDLEIEKKENGIALKLRDSSTEPRGYIYQYFHFNVSKYDGKSFTLAAKINGDIYTVVMQVKRGVAQTLNNWLLTFAVTADGKYSYCQIDVYQNIVEVEWAEVYEGVYTAETLPPFVSRPYAVELAECMKYHLPIEYGPGAAGYIDNTGSTIFVNIPVPVKMRILPSVIYDAAYGTLVIYTPSGKVFKDIKTVVAAVNSANFVQLKISFNDAFATSDMPCFVDTYDIKINMALNADL